MTPRLVLMSALAAVTVLPVAGPRPPWVGRVQAQDSLGPQRLAQVRRPEDQGGDPMVPGGLPGMSGRSLDSHKPMTRGISKSQKKTIPRKDREKSEDRTKKNQP
jgi:hypothetical protein